VTNLPSPPLRIMRAGEIHRRDEGQRWLIEPLVPHSACVIAGGQPKSFKSWLGLDVAVSVASDTPCLGHFHVRHHGTTLVYLAEDALPDVRARIECICRSRKLQIEQLDLQVVAEPVLRLDKGGDRQRLKDVVARLRPRLLVLDPLVRLHELDENSSQEISGLLGYLRGLQREHDVSVLLVHHTSKKSHARHGQSLRGSGDLHAWTDVGLYLTWQGDKLRMTPELRMARAPDPVELELVASDPASAHLEIRGPLSADPPPREVSLDRRVLQILERKAPHAVGRGALRDELRVNNAKLGDALAALEVLELAARVDGGWQLRQ
jgi:hypothetical protein